LTCQEEFRIQNTPSVFEPKDIERLNLDTLDNEYKNKSNLLRKLDLPKTQYWEDLRKSTLKELEQLYNLSRITYQSYSNPKYLKQFNHTDSCLLIHSNSLIAGGDSLLNDWFELTSQNVKKNGMPERKWKEYHIKFNSKDKLIFARVEVTAFGWWNCAIKYIDDTENYFNTETRLKEFAKLFFKTRKFDCAEP
jgi:hypothetical protein